MSTEPAIPPPRRLAHPLSCPIGVALSVVTLLICVALLAAFALSAHIANLRLTAQQQHIETVMRDLHDTVSQMTNVRHGTDLAESINQTWRDPTVGYLRIETNRGLRVERRRPDAEPASTLTQLLTRDYRLYNAYVATNALTRAGESATIEVRKSYTALNAANLQTFIVAIAVSLAAMMAATLATVLRRRASSDYPLTAWAMPASQLAATDPMPDPPVGDPSPGPQPDAERLRSLIDGVRKALFELDTAGRLTFINAAWHELTGYTAEDSLGQPLADFVMEQDVTQMLTPGALPRLNERNREICLRTAAGGKRWANLEARARFDDQGGFTGVIGTLGDVTESVEINRLLTRYQDELYHLSITDPLTGLYNRRHFDVHIKAVLAEDAKRKQSTCLFVVDVDGFKFINDTYGHLVGDEVLRALADLLRAKLRPRDYIARIAGDEFAILLAATSLHDARQLAKQLHGHIRAVRIDLPVGHLQLRASIGVAEAPTHGLEAQELVSAADVALYQGKRQGRNRVEILSPDISRAVMSVFSQGFKLRQALQDGSIRPVYQPIYDLRSGDAIAYEVLARMHDGNEEIHAEEFIKVAEQLGLGRDIDLHIIQQALVLASPHYALFLNISPTSIADREFVRRLGEMLAPACRAGYNVTLEITEREALLISDELLADISGLRQAGCRLALDDFGSGFSTYHLLNLLRPDYLKIDGSFVRRMLLSPTDHIIVEHIHELANAFGIHTIAESVEDEPTRRALRDIGVDLAQGLHLGPPGRSPVADREARPANHA